MSDAERRREGKGVLSCRPFALLSRLPRAAAAKWTDGWRAFFTTHSGGGGAAVVVIGRWRVRGDCCGGQSRALGCCCVAVLRLGWRMNDECLLPHPSLASSGASEGEGGRASLSWGVIERRDQGLLLVLMMVMMMMIMNVRGRGAEDEGEGSPALCARVVVSFFIESVSRSSRRRPHPSPEQRAALPFLSPPLSP